MIILLLLWLALTIFSIIGFLFFSDLIWDVFGQSDTIDTIAVVTNFYLSNFLAMALLRNNSVIIINRILILLITGILLGVGELLLGYYIVNDIFGLGENPVFFIMLFLFFIVVLFGGPRYFFIKVLEQLLVFVNAFFTGLQNNTAKRFLDKASKKGVHSEKVEKMRALEKENRELKDFIKKNSK